MGAGWWFGGFWSLLDQPAVPFGERAEPAKGHDCSLSDMVGDRRWWLNVLTLLLHIEYDQGVRISREGTFHLP